MSSVVKNILLKYLKQIMEKINKWYDLKTVNDNLKNISKINYIVFSTVNGKI